MFSIFNNQAETVRVKVGTSFYNINPFDYLSLQQEDEIILKVMHTDFCNISGNSKFLNKALRGFIKSSVLIVNSSFRICDIQVGSLICIKNQTYSENTEDFGCLFFELNCEKCNSQMITCEPVNAREVLKAQKMICFSESLDIPIISLWIAIKNYKKRKHLCMNNELLKKYIEQRSRETVDSSLSR